MPFNVGDIVCVLSPDKIRGGQFVRIEQILPKKLSVQDFQEYIVEFPNFASEKFRYCLYREFELSRVAPTRSGQRQSSDSMKPEKRTVLARLGNKV
jgi:hypothetical protein